MLRYAIQLIKAHGNSLKTDINLDGTLVDSSQDFKAPFERVSTSIRDAQAFTESVSRPKLTEKYQFPLT